ncbi:MAG: EutN/CcmL family microcompartment protein [Candidatus Eremiobacteraeota bacterium]|nr:EutN/CcmL family microcompartment protein [Candidatus Eremiobacteraeota bacterium]
MILAKVVGTVVCTQKEPRLDGLKLQLVCPLSLADMSVDGKPLVAVDAVGAGPGEVVLVAAGSSARQTEATLNTPTDAVIMGIVDTVEMEGKTVFQKHRAKE